MHPYLEILDYKILWYNIMTIAGLAVAYVYLYYAFASLGIPRLQIFLYLALGLAVQYLGGMLIPFLYRWIYRGQTPWLNVWDKGPGRYFHSVFLSMILFTVVFARAFRWPGKKILDRFMIAAMIASAVGRVGCYLQGCCRGKPSDIFCAIRFPRDPLTPLHPVQVYMFIAESLIVGFLFFLIRRKHEDGEIFWKGMGVYSLYRFLIEFLRTNPVFILGLTHAQVFSLLALVLSVCVLSRPPKPAPAPLAPRPRKKK
jgi:phosphatidylglycerol---prolipoprotein diacylglyceryl transferase